MWLNVNEIDKWSTLWATRSHRHLKTTKSKYSPCIGKAQNMGMRTGNKQMLNHVIFFHGGRWFAFSTTFLGLIIAYSLGFGIACTWYGHDHRLLWN